MPLVDQVFIFVWTVAIGMLAGLCYEIYRVIRDMLRLKKVGTFAGDIIFWLFLTAFSFFLLLKANYGQLRLYVFIGLLLGAFLFVRFMGGCAYRLVSWKFYLVGRVLKLLSLLLYYIWKVVTLPFRIVFIAVAFPVRLLGRLTGRAGHFAGRIINRPVNRVKGWAAGMAERFLKKFDPPR